MPCLERQTFLITYKDLSKTILCFYHQHLLMPQKCHIVFKIDLKTCRIVFKFNLKNCRTISKANLKTVELPSNSTSKTVESSSKSTLLKKTNTTSFFATKKNLQQDKKNHVLNLPIQRQKCP